MGLWYNLVFSVYTDDNNMVTYMLTPAALRGIRVTLNTKGGGKMALQKHRL